MLRFSLYLTVCIFILTTFPFFGFFLILIGFLILFILIEHYRRGTNKPFLYRVGVLCLAVAVSLISVAVSNKVLNSNILAVPEEGSYAITGYVVHGLKNNEYILDTEYGKMLLRQSDEVYDYGDQLLVNGFISPIDKDRHNQIFVKNLSNISTPGVLRGEFDYDMRLWTKGYVGDMYLKNALILDAIGPVGYLQTTRQWIKSRIQKIYKNVSHQALLNGMLTGDISRMSKSEYQGYIDSNLVHLVAVSGGNIVMLVIMLHYVLFFLPYKIRAGCIALSIVGYALLVGLDASVFRAMLMGVLTLFALISGRTSYVQRSIIFAWIILLLRKPYSLVYDLGFLLSFGALGGIVVFQNLITPYVAGRKRRSKSLLSEYVLANIGATLGVLPILIFFIGSLNVFGFVANIFVLPIVPFVMYIGALSLAIPNAFFSTIVSFLLEYIATISEFVGAFGAFLSIENVWIKGCFVLGMYLIYYWIYHLLRQQT